MPIPIPSSVGEHFAEVSDGVDGNRCTDLLGVPVMLSLGAGVVDFEKQLQDAASKQETLNGIPYLHEACVPIGNVDLSEKRGGYAQTSLFGNECEGMCGV
jgi:hypothetical protein